jgi:hypothetical protein
MFPQNAVVQQYLCAPLPFFLELLLLEYDVLPFPRWRRVYSRGGRLELNNIKNFFITLSQKSYMNARKLIILTK